jgi:hypothetical protein
MIGQLPAEGSSSLPADVSSQPAGQVQQQTITRHAHTLLGLALMVQEVSLLSLILCFVHLALQQLDLGAKDTCLCCCVVSVLQAGISPRILKYLWQRMPEVQADMLSHSQSKSGSLHSSSSSSSLGFMDMRNSLHAEDSQNAEQPNYQWLVRISIVEIHK